MVATVFLFSLCNPLANLYGKHGKKLNILLKQVLHRTPFWKIAMALLQHSKIYTIKRESNIRIYNGEYDGGSYMSAVCVAYCEYREHAEKFELQHVANG
jgi:hypothetical protein